jgi:isoamylase
VKLKNSRVTLPGYPLPYGATLDANGTQFSIFSRHAETVTLVLYESNDPESSFEEFEFDSLQNKTGDIWHIWIEGIREGQLYGYRVDGPYFPEEGHRFNRHKLLLDPYARSISQNSFWNIDDARGYDPLHDTDIFSTKDSGPVAPKSIVVNHEFDWFDRPLKTPMHEMIIYEAHVKGFTFHESSECSSPGTYKGLVEKIPYLKELGVTAIELLPVHEFDMDENFRQNPQTKEILKNYWGYSTISFFAPCSHYSSSGNNGAQIYEFKEMIRDFHNAGIEIILDVVFNHTAEGDHRGPTLSFRGIDNIVYYILESDRAHYKNFSGCGNTFNCNHPLVRDFILDCLRYWVIEMHVDGFRFDLASILGRSQDGAILSNPPLIERIESDPILRNTRIIAEAWDAAGAYQVGKFPGRWAEWNGRFRDDVRRFWRGDDKSTGAFATRISGSSDLYRHNNRSPLHSINFITSHDGFTLNDLVSYSRKHNYSNGENNRDGENQNLSYNYGIEGEQTTPFIESIRQKQIKNFMLTLMISQGVPMVTAGDEFRRTQKGNNNAYCQDNEISWVDWSLLERNKPLFIFIKSLISFRKKHPILRKRHFANNKNPQDGNSEISWHGVHPFSPDWSDSSKFIACMLNGAAAISENKVRDTDIYLVFNASLFNYKIELPQSPSGSQWRLVCDTANSDHSFYEEGVSERISDNSYRIRKQSSLIFIAGDL